MDEKYTRLHILIANASQLSNYTNWGTEFQLWEKEIGSLLFELFGTDAKKMFEDQNTVTTSYIDDGYNRRQYLKEIDAKVKVASSYMNDKLFIGSDESYQNLDGKDILKEIWKKEEALKENLVPTSTAKALFDGLEKYLEKTLTNESMPALRFKKMKLQKGNMAWWADPHGYPIESPWKKFQDYTDLLEQYEAEKTIKNRFENEKYFVESRSQGKDLHILIGDKAKPGEKAHIIIDETSGELRTEKGRQEPTELSSKIEAYLTLPDGTKIKSTRELLEASE